MSVFAAIIGLVIDVSVSAEAARKRTKTRCA